MNHRLDIAASHTLKLVPKIKFIPTGVFVQAGERYQLKAVGNWKDAGQVCNAQGWTHASIAWLRRFNRMPHANWFTLVACVGHTLKTARLVGVAGEFWITAQDCHLAGSTPAQLYVFANDWPCMYWNNKIASTAEGGPMQLSIVRLA